MKHRYEFHARGRNAKMMKKEHQMDPKEHAKIKNTWKTIVKHLCSFGVGKINSQGRKRARGPDRRSGDSIIAGRLVCQLDR